MDRLQEIANIQQEYYKIFKNQDGKTLNKQAISALLVPFRNKYQLTDRETLDIARSVMPNWKIANLIPVQEREVGKWTSIGRGLGFECSKCGYRTDFELSNFCPECGAKMQK